MATRVSPTAAERVPQLEDDTLEEHPPAVHSMGAEVLPLRVPTWDVGLLARWAEGYPCAEVVKLALQAAAGTLDPFVGRIDFAHWERTDTMSDKMAKKCRAALVKEVEAGHVYGPSPAPVFAKSRECGLFGIKKKKHDLRCDKIRLCTDFSQYGESSVNNLFYCPHLISAHSSAATIRDIGAQLGPDYVVWAADIPACFRRQLLAERLLPLFVYHVTTKEHGTEWFQDLRASFGAKPSEWGWQCLLAIILWKLRSLDIQVWIVVFVDNFFVFVHKLLLAQTAPILELTFTEAGVALHEQVTGPEFPGLGWEWDLLRQVMICPKAKMEVLGAYLTLWRSYRDHLSLPAVESAAGLAQWYAAGLHAFTPYVAPLIAMRTHGEAAHKRSGGDKRRIQCAFTKSARLSLDTITESFMAWSGECPMVQSFGPTAAWQLLGRVDACTDWGCGGIVFDGASLVGFMHQWDSQERDLAMCDVRESSGVFEILGAVYWLQLFGPRCVNKRVQIEMDSDPAVITLEWTDATRSAREEFGLELVLADGRLSPVIL